ncbi:SDR family NAD(P)-dependent oxidoreductase [Pseudomonas sp. N040]|uniref:SDR family NAD(P)-dependent oxidoreductase n=1 Tax=Pseudomonas sp. N040 TaxID=2785325 RepID=UPI0018A3155E|nr:SDR family oxidoreductase [Pseudomonas sp. N040]MBF7728904.1 SDR family oxidoreductase [Pseudomonas sp. N040]MBW7012544.1 SDR family oxidoreductase [Pseudomonas sp. N040]
MQPVVLITGAAGGLGSAVARRFANGGWRVAATDLNAAGLQALGLQLPLAASLALDLGHATNCQTLLDEVLARCGRLDALVNAAGVWREGPVEACSEADFDLVLNVNLKAAFFTCAAAIAPLRVSRGTIINIASDAGHQGNRNAALYCASKGALTLLSKTLALDLAADGIRVNAVSPGDIATPMLDFQAERYGGGDPQGYKRDLLSLYPQGRAARFIRPEEVAELVWFLCQPYAEAITGANLAIDFGLSAGK